MNNSINIVASTSYSLQINDKGVSKKAKRQKYRQKPEVKARRIEYNQRPDVKAKMQKYKHKHKINKKKLTTIRK